jgi:diaminopimelate decarboxylase
VTLRLWPDTAQIDSKDRLRIADCDVEGLCTVFGTPLYILDETTFRSSCSTYREALTRFYPGESCAYYSGKSLLNMTVARWVYEEGLGVDVVSAGEIFTAIKGGVPSSKLHVHGNAKPIRELEYAAECGVGAIVADNLDEVCTISIVASKLKKSVRVILRIAPGVGANTHPHIQTGLSTAKFGLILDHLPRVVDVLRDAGSIELIGLHFHLGSQIFDLSIYPEAIDVLLSARAQLAEALGYLPEELSPGGGLAVPYNLAEEDTHIEDFVRTISEATIAGCEKRSMSLPKLVLEPGRSISARAMVAAYEVVSRKDMQDLRLPEGHAVGYLHVDGGMADNLRPVLYGARYEASLATQMSAPRTRKVHISGRYCESSDVLIRDIQMPEANPGEIVVMPNCGAYSIVMASNYNLTCRPALVSVKNGRATLVQRRETFEDLVRRESALPISEVEGIAP